MAAQCEAFQTSFPGKNAHGVMKQIECPYNNRCFSNTCSWHSMVDIMKSNGSL